MANNHFITSIYKIGAQDLNSKTGVPALQGIQMSFPSAGVLIYPPKPSQVALAFGTVTLNSVIEVLPTGLTNPSKYYFSADTVATLNTAAI